MTIKIIVGQILVRLGRVNLISIDIYTCTEKDILVILNFYGLDY